MLQKSLCESLTKCSRHEQFVTRACGKVTLIVKCTLITNEVFAMRSCHEMFTTLVM